MKRYQPFTRDAFEDRDVVDIAGTVLPHNQSKAAKQITALALHRAQRAELRAQLAAEAEASP